jgi:superfamily I DNA/RNA helicase
LRNGLDDDAIVWFEPPFDATGRKPHFVVLMPDNGISVLEVLDVRQNKLLGMVRGRLRIERDGQEIEVEQPMERAEAFAQDLRVRIAADARLDGLIIAVQAAAVFPALDAEAVESRLDRAVDPARTIFAPEIEEAVAAEDSNRLRAKFIRLLGASSPLDDRQIDMVRAAIQPELVIGAAADDQLPIFRDPVGVELISVMDQRQEVIAKGLGEGHRVVRGVAGSGKTLILTHRAKLFAQLFPDHRFLLTCYTRSLAGLLRAHLADFENIEVDTLDRLIARAIREAELEFPGFEDEQHAKVGLQALERGALPRYRAVFIDEAQDFGAESLRFAIPLADERFNDVLIVADAAQNVFRRNFRWKDAGIQAQGRTKILRKNYRNTREILELAHALVPGGSVESFDPDDEAMIIPPEAAMREGPQPDVRFCTGDEMEESIVASAKEHTAGRKPASLAVLAIGNREAIRVERALRDVQVPLFFLSDPQQRSNRDAIADVDEPVVLSTVYSAKGLEFPDVILCCEPRSDQDPDELRKAIYVGMTRATERLTVFMDPDHPLASELQQAAGGGGHLPIESP